MDAMENFAISTVTVPPSPGDSGTTMTVADGSLFPVAPFDMTIWLSGSPRKPTAEICRVMEMSGNDITSMLRNQYGSTNQTITAGFQCEQGVTVNLLSQLGGSSLELSYNGVGPFSVPVSSLPAGWASEGIASMFAQLTTGDGLITGLEDASGNPIPDGFTFPATIFVEDTTIYDIIAINGYVYGNPGQSGISWWSSSGGTPSANIGPNSIINNLPMSDPDIAGALWNDGGTIVASGSIAPVAGAAITVNSGPVVSSGLLPLQIAKQPLVQPSAILQPLPPLIGFEFPGTYIEYPLADGSPYGICAGPDRNIWVNDNTGLVWRVTTTGAATSFSLPGASGGAGSICAGPDGNIWACQIGSGDGLVYQITPTGRVTPFTLAGSVPVGICAGPDGNLWVTDENAAVWQVASDGSSTKFSCGTQPIDICAGPDGNLYVADAVLGIFRVTTEGVATHVAGVNIRGICAGPDGNLWVSNQSTNQVGRFILGGDTVTYFDLTEGALPQGLCVGAGGDIWASDEGTNSFWKITTDGVVTQFAAPTTSAWVCSGPDGSLWLAADLDAYIFSFAFTVQMPQLRLTAIPTADPHVVGQFWDNAGVVNVSAG